MFLHMDIFTKTKITIVHFPDGEKNIVQHVQHGRPKLREYLDQGYGHSFFYSFLTLNRVYKLCTLRF